MVDLMFQSEQLLRSIARIGDHTCNLGREVFNDSLTWEVLSTADRQKLLRVTDQLGGKFDEIRRLLAFNRLKHIRKNFLIGILGELPARKIIYDTEVRILKALSKILSCQEALLNAKRAVFRERWARKTRGIFSFCRH